MIYDAILYHRTPGKVKAVFFALFSQANACCLQTLNKRHFWNLSPKAPLH